MTDTSRDKRASASPPQRLARDGLCGEQSPSGEWRCNATKGHYYDHFYLNATHYKMAQWPREGASMAKKAFTARKSADGGCRCPVAEAHSCPYAKEINDDSTTLCNCCEDCAQECAWDI